MKLSKETKRISRLAVQLSREDFGYWRTTEEVIGHAASLVAAGDEAKKAIEAGRSPGAAFAKAMRIAKLYMATLVERGDEQGMVMGLQLMSGRYSCGMDHVLHIA